MAQRRHRTIGGKDKGGRPFRDEALVQRLTDDVVARYGTMPVINKYQIRSIEMAFFEKYCETGSINKAAQFCGMSKGTGQVWYKSDWFAELYERFMSEKDRELRLKIASKDDDLVGAYKGVMTGDEAYNKLGTAVMSGLATRAKMGPDPIIKQRPAININNNPQNNTLIITQDKIMELARKDPQAIMEYQRTGIMPAALKVVSEGTE